MFINRKGELDLLTHCIAKRTDQCRLIIVSGGTGVGKTSLVDHSISFCRDRKIFSVAVEDHPRNRDDDRIFVIRLANAIIDQSQTDPEIPTLAAILQQMHGRKALNAFCGALAKHFGERYLGKEAFGILDSVNAGLLAGTTTLPETVTPELELYVQRVIANVPSLIRVQNAHMLDRRSLTFFLNLFSDCRGLLGIFEVTEAERGYPFTDALLRSFRERKVDVMGLAVAKLDLADIVFGLRDQPELLKSLVARSYDESDGNLHPLSLLTSYSDNNFTIGEAGQVKYQDITEELIESLPRQERTTLMAVVMHGGLVTREMLRAYFALPATLSSLAIFELNFQSLLAALERRGFLQIEADWIRVRHDSITAALHASTSTRALALAVEKAWRDFYASLRQSGDFFLAPAEVLDWLIYFNVRLEDSVQVINCLEEVGRLAFDSIAPRRLLDYLDSSRRKLQKLPGLQTKQSTLNPLLRQQALLLYEAGWFDEALECLNSMESEDSVSKLLRAELLCSIDRASDGIALASHLRERSPPDQALVIDLIRIHGLRMLDQLDEARSLYLDLINSTEHRESRFYPTLLRYSDLALYLDADQPRCIELLQESVAECRRLGFVREEAFARMALIQQTGYLHVDAEIDEHLDAIEAISARNWIQRYALINNRAVVDIFREACTDETLRQLSQALLLSSEFLDQLLIRNNQMIAASILGRRDTAERLADEITESVTRKPGMEQEIKKIALFNIARVLKDYGRTDEADAFLDQIKGIDTNIDSEFWRQVFGDGVPLSSPRGRIGFYPVFISYWYLSSSVFERISDQSSHHLGV